MSRLDETKSRRTAAAIISLVLLPGAPGMAQSTAAGAAGPQAASAALPVYKPPVSGAPLGRIGGGTRGGTTATLVEVLAPDHVGLTAQDQPTLFWYSASSVPYPAELTIVADDIIPPLLDVPLPGPTGAGIHAFSLKDTQVHLVPGKLYQWSVEVVRDPAARATDTVASGYLQRTDDPAAVSAASDVHSLASLGLWYDALAATAADSAERAALLDQVGLSDVAAVVRRSPAASP